MRGTKTVAVRAAWTFAVAAMVAAASPRSFAADGLAVEPGLWVVAWSVPDPLGGEPWKQTHRVCLRERSITAERVNSEMQVCRVSNAVFRGDGAKWKMRCDTPAGPMNGSGSLRSNGSAVAGTVDMSMAIGAFELPVSGSFRGRRVGGCPIRAVITPPRREPPPQG